MKPKSALLFLLAGLLSLMTIHIAQAQSGSKDDSCSDMPPDSESIAVVGAVQSPSRFKVRRSLRLLEAIQLAGGVTDEKGPYVRITHTIPQPFLHDLSFEDYNLIEVLRGDEKANPYLRLGDVVSVSDPDKVYVIGNVVKPLAVLYRESLTVSQAIALARGYLPDTRTSKIRVVRHGPINFTKTEITIDLKAITKGRAEDLVLQPNDIVYVPRKRSDHDRSFCPVVLVNQTLPLRIVE